MGGFALRALRVAALAVLVSLLAMAVAAVAMAEEPNEADQLGNAPISDAGEATRDRVAVWIVPWDRARVVASLRANAGSIGRISPFWFVLRPDGRAMVSRPGAMDREVLGIAEEESMAVLPTVGNEFDAKRLTRMLATPATRARHVRQLVALATSSPTFVGLDLDYENIAARDRARFAAFVHETAIALHARDLQLSVTVGASTRFMGSAYDRATDYASIGADADEVRVMAYDYHWSCGRPGPVAPIDWVERVVVYLGAAVPPEKLVLGMPLYGYDWGVRGCAKARTWSETQSLERRAGRSGVWTAGSGSWLLRYGRGRGARTLWFDDARSSAAKARVAARHGLRGVALWRTGGEDPATWDALTREFDAG